MIRDLLNVSEAAKLIGCTTGRVRQMLRSGELEGMKANERAWLVERKDALRVAKIEHSGGRPRISEKTC